MVLLELYLEAAFHGKHTMSEVIGHFLLADGIDRVLKGRPCRSRQELLTRGHQALVG